MFAKTNLTRDDVLDLASEFGTVVDDVDPGFVSFNVADFLSFSEALIEEQALAVPSLDLPMDVFISKALLTGLRDALDLRFGNQWPEDDPYVEMHNALKIRISEYEVRSIANLVEEAQQ